MISFYWLDILSRFAFVFALSYYSMSLLQWYNYNPLRVITKHHKYHWHFIYFIIPVTLFLVLFKMDLKLVFYAFLYIVYLPLFFYWVYRLDKVLVFTGRIWRFFGSLLIFMLLNEALFAVLDVELYYLWLLPFIFAICLNWIIELILMRNYRMLAYQKIKMMTNLKVIAITASFGKTSMKHFLAQVLDGLYNVHYTSRSINTIKGVVADINDNLDFGTDIYVVEAGAREKGDIAEIAKLTNPHIAVIGEIGKAHIEYFKTLENTALTKFELLESNRLEQVFVHHKNKIPEIPDSRVESKINLESKKIPITPYSSNIRNVQTTLEGTSFEIEIDGMWEKFETNVLGAFNVENIAAVIKVAKHLGVDTEKLQKAVKKLTPIPHRFNLAVQNGKTIIDDGFNGNLNGMTEGVRLCSLHQGKKIIVTPGLIETDVESNIELGMAINEVFDFAIITNDQNAKILAAQLNKPSKVILKDKRQLESVLKAMSSSGDLIYFANDAPSYI